MKDRDKPGGKIQMEDLSPKDQEEVRSQNTVKRYRYLLPVNKHKLWIIRSLTVLYRI